jgi:hypothetical protein
MSQFDCRTAKTEQEDDREVLKSIRKAYQAWVDTESGGAAVSNEPRHGASRVTFGSAPGRTFCVIGNTNGVLFVAEETKRDRFVVAERGAWQAIERMEAQWLSL